MEERKEEKIFHRNGEPIVISDLIMYVCPDCGQESMPLSSARIVEDILNGKVKPSGKFIAELYEISSIG
jgi:YgiT-type zinc finger domain-containing protein